MAAAAEPPLQELLWSVAAARIVLGGGVSLQAPPNLAADGGAAGAAGSSAAVAWAALLDAGINDWGARGVEELGGVEAGRLVNSAHVGGANSKLLLRL